METLRIINVPGETFEDLINAIEFHEGVRIRRRPPPEIIVEVGNSNRNQETGWGDVVVSWVSTFLSMVK